MEDEASAKPVIRLADPDDVAELARLRWEFVLEDTQHAPEQTNFEEFASAVGNFFSNRIEERKLAVFVAEVDGLLVSNLWVEIVDKVPSPNVSMGAWGYVTNVYTEPAYRGSGIGTKILEVAIRWASLKRLELLIVWPSENSVDFYRRAGFSSNPMLMELGLPERFRPSRRIWVTDYDNKWPAMFEKERNLIFDYIGRWVVAIEHVGSTAVPGLGAKPTIDILVGLERLSDFKPCILPLEEIGYEHAPWAEDEDLLERRYFRKETDGVRTHHLHMTEVGSDFFQKHLLFRDFLRKNPDEAAAYYELKKKLSVEFENNTVGYTEAKSEFVESTLRRAGWKG